MTIRVAVIGTGFMGKCHALAWRNVRAVFGDVAPCELVVLCDADAAAAQRGADEYGFARHATDWRAVVADPGVDAVSITTPNALHRPMAEAALAAGKHVWCEKPMATTLADAEAMAAAAEAAGRITLLGYNYLRNPLLRLARELIASDMIGRIVDFRGRFDEDYLADPSLPWSWRMRGETAGLGVLGDLTCHLVALARYLVGPVERVAATMQTVHASRALADGSGTSAAVDTEDVAHAVLRFAGGADGVIGSSRVAHGRKNALCAEIYGTKGMIGFDQERLNELQLFLADGPAATRGTRTLLAGPLHPPYDRFCPAAGHQLGFNDLKVMEAAHFLRCIAGAETPMPDFTEGLAIERTVHAMAQSARDGGWSAVG